MTCNVPIKKIERRLSWVGFLSPLSDEELDGLVRRANIVRFEKGEVMIVDPEEHRDLMLMIVEGHLQAYEISPRSGRELTLSVLAAVATPGTLQLLARHGKGPGEYRTSDRRCAIWVMRPLLLTR